MEDNIKRQLLVEGKDDLNVLKALCDATSIPETFKVIDCGGVNNLKEKASVILKQKGVEVLGIIIDADQDLRTRWESVKNILVNQHFFVPKDLPKDGLILKNDLGVKVGVWIMPNNNFNGMLEDFISLLVPKDDKLMPIVDATLEDIEKKNLNKYKAIHKSKAKIHTWLSWQENPGTPLGAGITKQIVATDSETCTQLVSWLKRLFEN